MTIGLFGCARRVNRQCVKGSHHVFRKAGVEEKVNLQREGHNAKPYQVKQVRAVILRGLRLILA